jgi:LAS superfamily LD-carboxypeptidase LdcB
MSLLSSGLRPIAVAAAIIVAATGSMASAAQVDPAAASIAPTEVTPALSIDDPTSLWVVVDKRRPLTDASSYVPPDLTTLPAGIPNPNGHLLRSEAVSALTSMFATAKVETGKQLVAQSGYRSYSSQQSAYDYYVSRLGQAGADLTSARPGFSEHQTGLAMDILDTTSGCGLDDRCFASTDAGRWLAANAYRFGWVLRYPEGQTAIAGYEFEPWHYRYVGIPLATDMHDRGIPTLEQYFGLPPAPSYLTSNDPFGTIDSSSAGASTASFAGWVADPDRPTSSLEIHAYVGGPYGIGSWGGLFVADRSRPDVASAFTGYGDRHGFELRVPIPGGSTPVCLYAINQGPGSSTLLGCPRVTSRTGSPFGNVEVATLADGAATVAGWALDPDSAESIDVHVYVNGRWGGAYRADSSRPDVAAVFPANGAAHGFTITGLRVPVGTNEICVYGIDRAGGQPNGSLGCRTVSSASGAPRGTVDSAAVAPGSVSLSGWALDPDTPDSIDVHVYVDGAWGGAYKADSSRPDVGAAFPGYGPAHGFRITVPVRAGARQVCVFAINRGAGGTNPLLSCVAVAK